MILLLHRNYAENIPLNPNFVRKQQKYRDYVIVWTENILFTKNFLLSVSFILLLTERSVV